MGHGSEHWLLFGSSGSLSHTWHASAVGSVHACPVTMKGAQPRPGELPTCALEPISNVACLVLAPQQPSRMVGESLTWDWISLGGWGGTSLWRGDAPQRETAPKALELSQHWAPGQRRKSTWQLKRQSQGLSQGEYQEGYKSIFRRMQRRFECGKKWMGRGLAEQEKLEWKWGRKLGE